MEAISDLDICHNYQPQGEELFIHTYPDPVLKKKSIEVENFDGELRKLAINMINTMYQSIGIGLAAPQIGQNIRMVVLDVSYDREKFVNAEGDEDYRLENYNPFIFINPKIIDHEGETTYQEGCLSVPGIYEDVNRYEKITFSYQDLSGEEHQMTVDGLFSICMQHEIDHLDGIIFIDHLSPLKKKLYIKKLTKAKKRAL